MCEHAGVHACESPYKHTCTCVCVCFCMFACKLNGGQLDRNCMYTCACVHVRLCLCMCKGWPNVCVCLYVTLCVRLCVCAGPHKQHRTAKSTYHITTQARVHTLANALIEGTRQASSDRCVVCTCVVRACAAQRYTKFVLCWVTQHVVACMFVLLSTP